MTRDLPPGQQLAAPGKWPTVGERRPSGADEPWSLEIRGCVAAPTRWDLDRLRALPQINPVVDIHCVTRWSKLDVPFQGVALSTLLEHARPTAQARFLSFVSRSDRRHSTSLPLDDALELGAFVALRASGEPLEIDRGGPIRLITPGRYFYKSVKWLEIVEVLEHDRLGYWEAEAGYHNVADPQREQRYIASTLTRIETAALLAARDFGGKSLLGIDAAGRELAGLRARDCLLRNADFRNSSLEGADFRRANLANARFQEADLRGALFVDADVEGADFSGADLRGADFRRAALFGSSYIEMGGDCRRAVIDETTQFNREALAALSPEQERFIRDSSSG